MTASHTNHQRAYCSANYCTSQSQENDKNQQWMCLCWGNIRGTPLSFLISSFLFLSLSLFLFLSLSLSLPFSSPPLLPPPPPPPLPPPFFYSSPYALCSCKRTIILTASLLCGAHGKATAQFSPWSYVNSFGWNERAFPSMWGHREV